MVFIPGPTQTPLDPDPSMPLTAMLSAQRRMTHWFIETDPSDIVLIPRDKVKVPGGGEEWVNLAPRPSQRVKMIFPFGQSDGIIATTDAQELKYQFIMVGEWNATIHTNDFWQDSDGQWWTVTGISPYNGYEVKAMITTFGGSPDHG